MTDNNTDLQYRVYLDTIPIAQLRTIGRSYGVAHASAIKKNELIEQIIDILTGKAKPTTPSGRGAPPKQSYIDPEITANLRRIRSEGERLSSRSDYETEDGALYVSSSESENAFFEKRVYTGVLEVTSSGYGFLRTKNYQPSAGGDVFFSSPAIHNLKLREGDFVACTAIPGQKKNDCPAVGDVLSVNGCIGGEYEKRPVFDSLTAQYAKEKISLSDSGTISLRMLDLFVPIGKGQRALIIAPPKAGKTTLLKEIAKAVETAHDSLHLIVLLIDERPEEVTDIRSDLNRAEVVYSTFDESAERHVRAAQLTIARAKRLAEQGKDVVVLLDSLTKLTRAYNNISDNTGKTLSGGLDANALSEPKRFFGAARNTVEAGSITVLATALVETGSRMDDIIYEEFKGTGNADIFLSRELAERRIFPAIDLRKSGTRKEELLLSEQELNAVNRLRTLGLTDNVPGVIDMLQRSQNNAEFVSRLPEWLKIYKKGS